MNKIEDIWDFINKTFIPTIYPVKRYNGENYTDSEILSYTSDENYWRINTAQLRQLRNKKPS